MRTGAGACDARRLARAADRCHVDVERRSKTSVEAQLLLAEVLSGLDAAEVQERQAYRLLELEGLRLHQQHPGNVRLDQGHGLPGLPLELLSQCVDQCGVHVACLRFNDVKE
jgi:hypothetical protein